MSACSRCRCTAPNPECYVCGEPGEEPDTYPNDLDVDHDAITERLLERADRLRTERKDRAIEYAMEARGEGEEEERKLGTRED